VPIIDSSIQGEVLNVQFDGTLAVQSLKSAKPGTTVYPNVQGGFTSSSDIFSGQGQVYLTDSNTGTLIVRADLHTVGSGSKPPTQKAPINGMEIKVFTKTCASLYGISWQNYPAIFENSGNHEICKTPFRRATTNGLVEFTLPPGEYVAIGKYTVGPSTIYPGVSVGTITAGTVVEKYLQVIVNGNGDLVPAKYQKIKGSELLIIEPEYVEWSGAQELYPFVFESIGDWNVTTSVQPPEGFVTDYSALATQVNTQLKAVQFTITDVGTKWKPSKVKYKLKHNGKTKNIESQIGIKLAPELAKKKGVGIYGQ
jgi:hypothetical protein